VNHHLASDEEPQVPGTVGIATWSVDLGTLDEARIELGLDTTYGMTAPVDLREADFRALLLARCCSRTEDVYPFSDLRQDIFIINRSGGVEWRLPERVAGGNGAWGGAQHGHHLLDDGILIFANNGGLGNVSAVIACALDGTERMRCESVYGATKLGDVERLPGGNILITYSTDSTIHEIDSKQNRVLQISGGGNRIGYAVWRETLYGASPDMDL
jgi:hypothetical protein